MIFSPPLDAYLDEQIRNLIQPFHLLKHPFYQAWMAADLSIENLRNYAIQYYPHVKAFPRFVSAIHSQCEDSEARIFLLENLIDEEGHQDKDHLNHPQLWKQFAEGVGVASAELETALKSDGSHELVARFWSLCRSSYSEGLAALYAYEYQVPEISTAKIQGLRENYQIDHPKTLAFFEVHQKADVYHSDACARLLNGLSKEEKHQALQSAKVAATALWEFLTDLTPCEIYQKYLPSLDSAAETLCQ